MRQFGRTPDEYFLFIPVVKARTRLRVCWVQFQGAHRCFGYRARVPLSNGRADRTEVDFRLGVPLIEAKLTENDFQGVHRDVLLAYATSRMCSSAGNCLTTDRVTSPINF